MMEDRYSISAAKMELARLSSKGNCTPLTQSPFIVIWELSQDQLWREISV